MNSREFPDNAVLNTTDVFVAHIVADLDVFKHRLNKTRVNSSVGRVNFDGQVINVVMS